MVTIVVCVARGWHCWLVCNTFACLAATELFVLPFACVTSLARLGDWVPAYLGSSVTLRGSECVGGHERFSGLPSAQLRGPWV